MCHKYLQVQLGENINFITGNNGSKHVLNLGGKSAILAALIVALGGKASVTSRGSSVSKLLKEGTRF
jgi:chromosome segregation ATPase